MQSAAYVPPSTGAGYNPAVYSPTSANWTQNSNFLALGKWQKSIDRIGIIDRPKTPAAWKGTAPEVIYVWTGKQWYQLNAPNKDTTAIKTLRRKLYDFTRKVSTDGVLSWSDNDTRVLQEYAAQWGYEWLGTISTGRGDL